LSGLPLVNDGDLRPGRRLPAWLKRPLPIGGALSATRRIVGASGVATVCEEAHCPNLTECWSHRTATFMILGDRCTRACRFCAVRTARPEPLVPDEPARLAEAAAKLGLRHVVITAVARDDLPDEGAGQFAACVRAVRQRVPAATVEVLPADFHARPELIATVCEAGPDVYNHNLETVERLTPVVRPQAKYRRSLEVLRRVKSMSQSSTVRHQLSVVSCQSSVEEHRPAIATKSGLMVGLGETHDELRQTLEDLRAAGCEIVTVGQYLQPSPRHAPVERFYEPAEFEALADLGRQLGFTGVAAGPFVRSSYNASEMFEQACTRS
jgi:lipoyl synthase